jgi:manganese/zinc/iron transport system ATP- binding protein
MNLAVEVSNLTVAYHEDPVLQAINLAIPAGIALGIIGPNGAGKSTLVKAILQLQPSRSGNVQLFGQTLQKVRQCIAYVPQKSAVDWDFPTTVLDAVLMGTYGKLGWFRRPGTTEKEQARAALEQVGLTDLAHRQIGQLSGGQQQRLFLARALVQQADLLFLDEPFQGVDAVTESTIIGLLHQLRTAGKTIIVVHHDLSTVKEYFDWVLLLNRHVIGFGLTENVFTEEAISKVYGRK